MQFFYFHLMPWPFLPRDFDRAYDSAWVTLPNRLYDPRRGHRLYNEYLDELEYAEQLGFDGLCVNEHHQNAYGTMPSPNLMAAALARRTTRAKLAILGNAIGLRDHPLRVAEEIAMLDVISGGRVISGFVRGIGCEHLSLGVNPTYSRERFYEAHDLILRAWTEPGPFSFEGRHYQVRYANIWPRPLQQPHPPVWLPSQGSPETIVFAARNRYPFVSVFTPYANTKRLLTEYREQAERLGYQAPPEQLGFAVATYVAATDAQARREAKPHLLWLFRRGLKIPPHFLAPPGYLSEDTLRRFLLAGVRPPGELSFEELEREGYVLVGSPQTVRQKLEHWQKELGCGVVLTGCQTGAVNHELTRKSVELFSREVIPYFRARAGQPAQSSATA
jgi:alkanesulfonate monooxygenase SsuD/methylene tetrahydromethanopterin reductase-like flavin-dependent oxidoreductase (luciferase family)